jgi:3-oxoadipate enol-lactonase
LPWLDTGNVTLHYEQLGVGDPPVILIHELGGNWQSWRQLQPVLAESRRTYAVDLRGYGLSEKPIGPYEIEVYADDLATFARTAKIGVADVIGVAMGAVIGASLAIRHPDLVRRLVLCDGTDGMTAEAKRYCHERAVKVRATGMRPVETASLANSFPQQHAALREDYHAIYLANDPIAYAEASDALARMNITAEDYARVKSLTLVVTGAHDFIWPPEAGKRLANLIPGARFAVIADAGHFPHIQMPTVFARLVLEFLDEKR